MLDQSSKNLSRAILHTVAYSDVFDYPLTAREIHRYLTGVKTSLEEVVRALEEDGVVTRTDDYFTLPGREEIVRTRRRRLVYSAELLQRAIVYGRMLGSLPYIRMVALTGSLAVMNVAENQDFDYMLVTTPGRLWTGRAFALVLNRLAHLDGFTLCPNLIVSESALRWTHMDLYTARELCQMIPVTGLDVYQRLIEANEWVEEFLPNAYLECTSLYPPQQRRTIPIQSLFEYLLCGNAGDKLENWEMARKIARFSKQAGFGEETFFNADVCQGNFHHHRRRTQKVFNQYLEKLNLESDALMSILAEPSSSTS